MVHQYPYTLKTDVLIENGDSILKDLGHFPHQSAQLKGIPLACGIIAHLNHANRPRQYNFRAIQNWESEHKT